MRRQTLGTAVVIVLIGLGVVATGRAQELPPVSPPTPAPSVEPLPEPAPAFEPAEPSPAPLPIPAPRTAQVPRRGTLPLPPRDPAVRPVEDDGPNPLPLAIESPGAATSLPAAPPAPTASEEVVRTAAPGAAPDVAGGGDPFVIPPETLPLGRQGVALTIDVRSPPVINLGKEVTLQVVVKNTGTNDALGVVVRDPLPEGLEFLSSVPAESSRVGNLVTWKVGTIPAGSERPILVKVKANAVGSFDHAATVSMLAGGRSRTMVQQPLLKVEQKVTPSKVLRGQPVEILITIENPGTGPARDVVVEAKLTSGLKHPQGNHIEYLLASDNIPALAAGKRIELKALVVDAASAGSQECVVTATSPDVNPGAVEATATAQVTVVEPKLKLEVAGPPDRYTEQLAAYTLTLENTGTAPARNARITALVDKGVKLLAAPDAAFDTASGRLTWDFPAVEPGTKVSATFQVRTGGIGLCQVATRAVADGVAPENKTFNTNVKGIAEVVFDVVGQHRVLDVGDTTTFSVRLRNQGTKDAAKLLLQARLSKNLEVVGTEGTEQDAGKTVEGDNVLLKFPLIDKLGTASNAGRQVIIRARAIAPGQATCRVYLLHDDLLEPLDRLAVTRVLEGVESRPR